MHPSDTLAVVAIDRTSTSAVPSVASDSGPAAALASDARPSASLARTTNTASAGGATQTTITRTVQGAQPALRRRFVPTRVALAAPAENGRDIYGLVSSPLPRLVQIETPFKCQQCSVGVCCTTKCFFNTEYYNTALTAGVFSWGMYEARSIVSYKNHISFSSIVCMINIVHTGWAGHQPSIVSGDLKFRTPLD